MFNETSHSFFVWGIRERLLPCCVVTAKWVVSCTQITCIQPQSRCSLILLASSFFSESVVVVVSLFSPSFSPYVLSFLSLAYWPFHTRLLACLIRAANYAYLLSSAFVYIPMLCHRQSCLAFCFISLQPLFFQMEAGLVRGQLELVMVSLAFHLFVVGTVIFALCSYDCSLPLLCCRQQSVRLL